MPGPLLDAYQCSWAFPHWRQAQYYAGIALGIIGGFIMPA